jgi:phosphotransferase system IIA component
MGSGERETLENRLLAPKQTKHVSVTLNRHAFAYYDVDAKKWTIAPGSFGIHVGIHVGIDVCIHVGIDVYDLILNGKVEIPESVAANTF